jgi:hypothetical protein
MIWTKNGKKNQNKTTTIRLTSKTKSGEEVRAISGELDENS